jgi:protein-S-isoprenylcysteine O-methyltransferase Ste14
MIIRIGRFLFHYRNGLFPLVYALLLLKSPPLFPDFRAAALLGFLVALTGQGLRALTIGLEYIIRGGRNRQVYAENLVQGGVFAHCRNPLYLGNIVILLGVGLASNSIWFLCTALPFFAFAYWAIIAAEEDYLRIKFGREFDAYCARVNRLFPNFSGITLTFTGARFNWRRLISAEYGSTFIWLAAIILVTLKNVAQRGEYQTDRVFVSALWILLALVTLGYAIARFLKKSRRLEPGPAPVAATAPVP